MSSPSFVDLQLRFLDLHWTTLNAPPFENDSLPAGSTLSGGEATIRFINRVLDDENPDLVVFTGDNTDTVEEKAGLEDIYNICVGRNIQFCVVLGNHDAEKSGLSRKQVIELTLLYKGCLAQVGNVSGAGNYRIDLMDTAGQLVAPLYFIDSGSAHEEHTYDYVKPDQIDWLRSVASPTSKNALLFMHIAPREILDRSEIAHEQVGDWREQSEPSKFNSGIYQAMKEEGILAAFFGHDHLNDFALRYDAQERGKREPWLGYCGSGSYVS